MRISILALWLLRTLGCASHAQELLAEVATAATGAEMIWIAMV